MKKYMFETSAIVKDRYKKYWIDKNIIPDFVFNAEDLKTALLHYQHEVDDKVYVTISNNAIRTKSDMFVDTANGSKQVGYVITGRTSVWDEAEYKWKTIYINLWVNISILENAFI